MRHAPAILGIGAAGVLAVLGLRDGRPILAATFVAVALLLALFAFRGRR